jgi:hypothetical protein
MACKMIRNQRFGIAAGGRSDERDVQVEDCGAEDCGAGAVAAAAARVGARLALSTDSRYDVSAQAEDELLA